MYLPRSSGQISQHKEEYGNSQKRIAVIVLFFTMILSGVSFLAPSNIIAQEVHGRQASSQQERISFRVVSWNIENLFDTHHDSLKNDHEYLPDAIRHWNYSRYKKKLADVARVITAIGEWNPPALVGLCEVENDTVLRDLTRRSPLKELSYRYVMTNSPDLRGIDVALLYQRDLFKLLSSVPSPFLRLSSTVRQEICYTSAGFYWREIHSTYLSATFPAVRVEPKNRNLIVYM